MAVNMEKTPCVFVISIGKKQLLSKWLWGLWKLVTLNKYEVIIDEETSQYLETLQSSAPLAQQKISAAMGRGLAWLIFIGDN